MSKRLSKYVRYYTLEDHNVLYHMPSDSIIVLTPQLSEIFAMSTHNIDRLKQIHPDFYNTLCDDGFIINADENEYSKIIEKWQSEDKSPKSIKLTINPTLQCNLNCWYCYESHAEHQFMDIKVLEATKRYMTRLFRENMNSNHIISFFGGEPLLYFSKIVQPIISFAKEESARIGIGQVGIAFTTNGTLLSDSICSFLKSTGLTVSFQITLDGNQDNHNKTRFFKNGVGTYDIIITNIKRALSYGFHVNVRFNYTNDNYSECRDILSEFVDMPQYSRELIEFSFHKVWQEDSSNSMESSIRHDYEIYLTHGFNTSISSGISSGRCYADLAKNIVINYDGTVYKCTARDFKASNADGQLLSDGTILWNENGKLREHLKFGSEACKLCAIFPICHNGCSQDKLEQSSSHKGCPRGYDASSKEQLAKSQATSLLLASLATLNQHYV